MKVVIALGSNLGESYDILEAAVEKISNAILVTDLSTFIETEPVGGPAQPNYINAVLIGESSLEPLDLLHELQKIENDFGRTRELRWGARTLDLDLIDAGGIIMNTPELELPHPRAHERAFVLQPWVEIDPGASIPGRGLIASLLSAIEE
jgi:2-amino-4-hydroxy-6-hydroxymethyldihydropteridine diphosphokinase